MSHDHTHLAARGQRPDCLDNGDDTAAGPGVHMCPAATRRVVDERAAKRFARVPVALLRQRPADVGDGAMRYLLALLVDRAIRTRRGADPRETRLYRSAGEWARELQVQPRQIRRWRAELRVAGLIS